MPAGCIVVVQGFGGVDLTLPTLVPRASPPCVLVSGAQKLVGPRVRIVPDLRYRFSVLLMSVGPVCFLARFAALLFFLCFWVFSNHLLVPSRLRRGRISARYVTTKRVKRYRGSDVIARALLGL